MLTKKDQQAMANEKGVTKKWLTKKVSKKCAPQRVHSKGLQTKRSSQTSRQKGVHKTCAQQKIHKKG